MAWFRFLLISQIICCFDVNVLHAGKDQKCMHWFQLSVLEFHASSIIRYDKFRHENQILYKQKDV